MPLKGRGINLLGFHTESNQHRIYDLPNVFSKNNEW